MNTIYDGSYTLGSTSALTFEAGPGIKIDEPSAGTVRIGMDGNEWVSVLNEVSYNTSLMNAGGFNLYYNKALKLVTLTCDVQIKAGSVGTVIMTWSERLKPANTTQWALGDGIYVDPTKLTQSSSQTMRWIAGCWTWGVKGE